MHDVRLPSSAKFAIIGAGVHGLSTAFHLAEMLKATGRGSGEDIVVVDKTAVGAGASGIACGVVRNNYFQPAMRELMAHSVDVWESDMETYSYHPVGYMQISPECMHADVASIYEQQKAIGYDSVFVEGAADSAKYMKGLFDDWQAQGITSVLHESRGGYANNMASMQGLARKAENEGVRILSGVEVTSFEFGSNSNAVTALNTNQGRIACETVVVGVGPWVNRIWNLLELPKAITVKHNGVVRDDVPMWKFWCLEEGTLAVDPNMHKTNDGRFPPVLHVDTDAPLYSDRDGRSSATGSGASTTSRTSISAAFRAAPLPIRSSRTRTKSPSIPTGLNRRISSSARISSRCGARRSPTARSVSKARYRITSPRRNPAGLAASRRTISPFSIRSAKMFT
jgi:hypothetical protein